MSHNNGTSRSKPIIAVDLDDVLSQTNLAAADWHNRKYGTKLDLTHFYYVNYWKNPCWGTKDEATTKIKDFFTDDIMKMKPVPEAQIGLSQLRDLGFDLIVVTARHIQEEARTKEWLHRHYPDMFKKVICTGRFYIDEVTKEEKFMKTSKLEECKKEGVSLLIDDSVENALECGTFVKVLLFGNYEWNKRLSKENDPDHFLTHDERLEKSAGSSFWESDNIQESMLHNLDISRVQDWEAIRQWALQNLRS